MALLSIFRGTQAECAARPVSDGALLFATDTKKIYLDKDSTRIEMGSAGELGDYITQEELEEALSGKADKTHTHTQDQITGLEDALAGKAPVSHSHTVADTNTAGFMSAADKQKLDGIAAGANNYVLPAASAAALGGVKIGYEENGKNYPVELDNENQMYVNVPWTDTVSKDTNTTYTLTKSGSTITLEGSDGSSTTVQDADTTYTLGSFGITATAAELNYMDGVTSNVQTQLNGKAASSHNHSAANITSGTLSADRIPTITDGKIESVSASKITGTIPQSALPSYVDDVLEYKNLEAFPDTGESGKIYVAQDTNKTYRWSGAAYVEISASLALGTTSSTAFRGDYGNTAYQHAAAKGSAFASGLYKITTNSQGHVTAATAVTKSDITALGIPGQDTNTTYGVASSSANGLMSAADKAKLDGIASGANKYTLPTASSSTLGGVKTGANITNSSGTISLTKANVTAALGYTPPTADTNTWIAFKGATTSAAGTAGYAPAPAAGAANRYLRSDGTWAVPPDTNTDTNTTYTLTKSGSTITLTGSNGSKTSVTDSNTTYTLSSFGITATAAEINKLDGLTATTAELNYVDGVTSNIQTQLNGKAASSHTHNYAGSSSAGGAATSAAKLNGVSLVGKNLNDYHSGVNFYYGGGGNNCTNKPSGVDNFGMFVFQTANGWWTQLLYGSDDHLYMRRWASNNSWTSWVEIYSSNNKPTASEIGAAASSHNHSAANITSGTLSIAHGGTGATTAAAARSALGAAASDHTHSYLPLSGGTLTGTVTSRSLAAATDSTYDIGTSSVRYRNIYADNLYGTLQGSVTSANKLTTARTISLAGDVTGSTSFNGSANVSISANLAANSVTANEIAAGAVGTSEIASDAVTLAKLGSDVGTIAVQSSTPTDANVKLWIQI